jgi:hypothetical protein
MTVQASCPTRVGMEHIPARGGLTTAAGLQVRVLCRLPYAGALLPLVEATLLERAALAAPDATPAPLRLLAAFHQSRGNHRAAAAALVAFALQLSSTTQVAAHPETVWP